LWKAVDPDGSLNLGVTTTRAGARRVLSDMPKLSKPMSGEAESVLSRAANLPDVIPFKELTALRSRVSEAMSEERSANGKSTVYGRLSHLRGAIEHDIDNAVAAKAAQEQRAVQAGVMSEEDTVAAMLAKWEQDRGAWYDQRATSEMGQSVSEGGG